MTKKKTVERAEGETDAEFADDVEQEADREREQCVTGDCNATAVVQDIGDPSLHYCAQHRPKA